MQTAYPWGNDIGKGNANCYGCGSGWDAKQPAPVGSFAPNNFGLYDMVGNVFEWMQDCVHTNYNGAPQDGSPWTAGGVCTAHIIRGGSWNSGPEFVRSAFRGADPTVDRRSNVGFRVALSIMR